MVHPSDYTRSLGRLERGRRGDRVYHHFVPPLLPRGIEYSSWLVSALSVADRHLGRLSSIDDLLPNPRLLIVPYMKVEALLSSKIEGTQASLSDVFLEESITGGAERSPDATEVLNYVVALESGIKRIGTSPLDADLLRELHGMLLAGVRGQDKSPGRFRTEQNWIGPPSIDLATYVPPDVPNMERLLGDFDAFLKERPDLPILIQAALLHYQFEAIHPFRDGNGRIGRLMIILFLLERKALSSPLLYLSAFFERNRSNYYEALRRVSEEGAYEDWLVFFLEAVATQAEDAVNRAKRLVALRENYRETLQGMGATASAMALVDRLFANPFLTIPQAAADLRVTFPTAQRAIEGYLVPAGVLAESAHPQRPRQFRAKAILDAIEI